MQTKLSDFGRELLTDGGQQQESDESTFDADAETVTDDWEGVYIYESWGYNQTNVDFAQIVDVSDTGKTVLCRMVKPDIVETESGSQRMRPDAEQYGDEFRLHVRCSYKDEPVFRGSYPYIDGDADNSTRKGSFMPFSNAAGTTVHQTAPGYRH